MYTRTDNPLHIIQEVLDNASDEALGGFGKHIIVTLHSDSSVSVEDDGRGIPVGMHPTEKLPVVEIVFTQLHAGGKFEKGSGGAYAFSGGLHGVGVSVTNALSKRLEVTVWREGQVSTLTFADGRVIEKLKTKPSSKEDKSHGTRVRAWPDGKYFDSSAIPMADLIRLLRSKAVLLPGVKVTLIQEKSKDSQTWQYAQGLRGYLNEAIAQAGHGAEVIPPFEGEQYATGTGDDDSFAEGEAHKVHPAHDVGAAIASGSFQCDGMVIAPCSMRTLAAVAHGMSDNLLTRAADVMLKERRRLVLMVRETPLNLAHLRNMTSVTEMGGIIFPPVPSFYHAAVSIDDLVNQTLSRVLDLLGLPQADVQRWAGLPTKATVHDFP